MRRTHRALPSIALIGAAACGGNPTTPSPSSPTSIHFTLNAADNRDARRLQSSYLPNTPPGHLTGGAVNHQAADDFTPLVTTAVRTVSWQGGYVGNCVGLVGAITPPTPASRAFVIGFYADRNGMPELYGTPLYEVRLSPTDAHERFTFDTGTAAPSCNAQTPASYYEYTAVLPTPFPVTAGTRYWLSVRGDTPGDMPVNWGWRVGTQDNNYSVVSGPGISLLTSPVDLAFSLLAD